MILVKLDIQTLYYQTSEAYNFLIVVVKIKYHY